MQNHDIDLRLDCEVAAIDVGSRQLLTGTGERFAYDALLLATGAEPRRLPTPGFDRPNVFALRSLADARAIIAACEGATSVAFIGAGFIGLEAAGALRARGLAVHVAAPEEVPMERVLGREVGRFITGLHEEQGVTFHLRSVATGFDGKVLTLEDGTRITADLVIVGAGVTPRTQLAAAAGIAVQDGILVDAHLQTSLPGIYAAGDVARYPHGGELIRVEHWVHAQRQGQLAAANMLGGDAGVCRRAVLLDPPPWRGRALYRRRERLGRNPHRRRPARTRLHCTVLPRRKTHCCRVRRPRPGEPGR